MGATETKEARVRQVTTHGLTTYGTTYGMMRRHSQKSSVGPPSIMRVSAQVDAGV